MNKASSIAIAFVLVLAGTMFGSRANALAAVSIACPPATATPVAATPTAELTDANATFPAAGGSLTVFAAASLSGAFTEIGDTLRAGHPELKISFNFAGSQALVTQLLQGARADVFASAGVAQMTAAVEAGVVAGSPVAFAGNRLIVVVPRGNPAALATPADLANPGTKIVLAQAEVPAGQYARQSLCKMGGDPAIYGAGFVEAVAANIVSEEDNVKAVLAKVQLGEADAGIVYTSDLTTSDRGEVTPIEIPDPVNVTATYPIAPVSGGNSALAAAFIAYVIGPDGQAALQRHGFTPVA